MVNSKRAEIPRASRIGVGEKAAMPSGLPGIGGSIRRTWEETEREPEGLGVEIMPRTPPEQSSF